MIQDTKQIVYALCPTYGRPRVLLNSIACFLAQDYFLETCKLLICDDGNQLPSSSSGRIEIVSTASRFPSISAKYNWMAEHAIQEGAEILIVWEDDDVYLSNHISSHVRALQQGLYSKPSRVLSMEGRSLKEINSDEYYHASVAFHRDAYRAVGGWPDTKRADFDQQFLAKLKDTVGVADTCQYGTPSYVYRWESTGHEHGQSQMRSDDDETWWDRCRRDDLAPMPDWKPNGCMDDETKWLYERFAR